VFEELISYGIDGMLIDFLRTRPTIIFPDPLIQRFKKLYGVDPRSRPPEDPRILRLQADFVTDFLKSLRAMLKRRNPAHQLHVRIDSLARRKGWDVDTWIRKAIVDAIILEHTDSFDPGEPPDLQASIERNRRTQCKVIAGFYRPYWGEDHTHPIHEAVVREKAQKYFAMGADGVSFYETAEVLLAPRLRQAIRRITKPETPRSMANK